MNRMIGASDPRNIAEAANPYYQGLPGLAERAERSTRPRHGPGRRGPCSSFCRELAPHRARASVKEARSGGTLNNRCRPTPRQGEEGEPVSRAGVTARVESETTFGERPLMKVSTLARTCPL